MAFEDHTRGMRDLRFTALHLNNYKARGNFLVARLLLLSQRSQNLAKLLELQHFSGLLGLKYARVRGNVQKTVNVFPAGGLQLL